MTLHYAEDLAYVHDAGFGEVARAAAACVRAELAARGIERGLVVDLGSGGGILAAELAAAGFDVLGIDQSELALALARRRVPRARFEQGSLFAFEPPPCSAVTALEQRMRAVEPGDVAFLGFLDAPELSEHENEARAGLTGVRIMDYH